MPLTGRKSLFYLSIYLLIDLFLDRFGILQEVRNAAQFDGIEIIVVDLGVRDYSNFVNGMTQKRENVINFLGQSSPQIVRDILDRICEGRWPSQSRAHCLWVVACL